MRSLREERLGQVRINSHGEAAKCVEYNNNDDIIIQFDNGLIAKSTWTQFNQGMFRSWFKQYKDLCGIYKVDNIVNGKIYIGQSEHIGKRWQAHRNRYCNENDVSYNSEFYKEIRKYGIDNFKFEIIEQCDKELLNEREQYWIEYYDTFNNGYNSALGGSGSRKVDYNALKEYYLATNCTINELGEKFNIDRSTAGRLLKKLGVQTRFHLTDKEKEIILDKYNNGCSITEIGKIINRDRDIISNYLKSQNIKIDQGSTRRKMPYIYVYDTQEEVIFTNFTVNTFYKYLLEQNIIDSKSSKTAITWHIKRKSKLLYKRFIVRNSLEELKEEIQTCVRCSHLSAIAQTAI